jgi:ATP/maltotriose-dependent transcriptional regulator MalT
MRRKEKSFTLQGDHVRAHALAEESLALCKELDHGHGIASSLTTLGQVALNQGHYPQAHALLEESLTIFQRLGDGEWTASSLRALGQVALNQGHYPQAHALFEQSLALFRRSGDQEGIHLGLSSVGRVACEQGDYGKAQRLLEESLAIARKSGHRGGIVNGLYCLGNAALGYGDYTTAQARYQESLTILLQLDDKYSMASCLEKLGRVALAQEQPAGAARLWGMAETLREKLAAPVPPGERAAYERALATARSQLGEEAFALALAEGRTMMPEQALAARGLVALHRSGSANERSRRQPLVDPLSERELEVLRLVAGGASNDQIADQLVIAVGTVKRHASNILAKLAVTNRTQAVAQARAFDLL